LLVVINGYWYLFDVLPSSLIDPLEGLTM